ncbi:flocculation protein FLO11 [Aplysia californica]|uniref:Flocculation protein FLO11 n=1 Tax=Aplysia californica TaxID=6500 RepID=A0ABM1A892_APLCA|nr:flocculation protein FLO11 [Aplysia californica]
MEKRNWKKRKLSALDMEPQSSVHVSGLEPSASPCGPSAVPGPWGSATDGKQDNSGVGVNLAHRRGVVTSRHDSHVPDHTRVPPPTRTSTDLPSSRPAPPSSSSSSSSSERAAVTNNTLFRKSASLVQKQGTPSPSPSDRNTPCLTAQISSPKTTTPPACSDLLQARADLSPHPPPQRRHFSLSETDDCYEVYVKKKRYGRPASTSPKPLAAAGSAMSERVSRHGAAHLVSHGGATQLVSHGGATHLVSHGTTHLVTGATSGTHDTTGRSHTAGCGGGGVGATKGEVRGECVLTSSSWGSGVSNPGVAGSGVTGPGVRVGGSVEEISVEISSSPSSLSSSVTSPATDVTSPGTEDRTDNSTLPDLQSPCDSCHPPVPHPHKTVPLDLSSRKGHK